MKELGKNIILIGLPGAGKTTLGKLLSNITGYRFIDSDAFIEEKTGKSITELFQEGEDHFRSIESEAYKKIADFEDTIVSTGGGVVKRNENIVALKRNGTVYYIDRSVEDISHDIEVSHRPLLKDGLERIHALKAEREALYQDAADCIIKNDKPLEEVADEIIAHHYGSGKGGSAHDNPQ
ncbi:shikimate kinase [Trichococcus ilyis]|uniref:Shikimate kinase n=1 Tax=Trichococcus ilyis TaxID=640938 RepID=A0A143YX57_9LACT|nr:shikimate kinase [Trichococcus ilyis]SEJ36045.1 shikimate kinase [Trichococcus ilyis]